MVQTKLPTKLVYRIVVIIIWSTAALCLISQLSPAKTKRRLYPPIRAVDLRSLSPRSEDSSKNVTENNQRLAVLSALVQSQLESLQRKANCTGRTLKCGHIDYCGLGCQIHHRMTCLALSYATGYPLIHDEVTGWPYERTWRDAFQKLGSSCAVSDATILVLWTNKGAKLTNMFKEEVMPFPLQNGLIVPESIGRLVGKLHENPFLWWVGQFAKFTMRLSKSQAQRVKEDKLRIGFGETQHADFGVHIRRTDKKAEAPYQNVTAYFKEVDGLQHNFFNHTNSSKPNQTIFVASDDHTILEETRDMFPQRNIIGFSDSTTQQTQPQRGKFINEAIRDIVILSESDFIVCTMSSNFGRLLFELLNSRLPDATQRLKSLDANYGYIIYGTVIPNVVIFKE